MQEFVWMGVGEGGKKKKRAGGDRSRRGGNLKLFTVCAWTTIGSGMKW